jgi:hypothetical protein
MCKTKYLSSLTPEGPEGSGDFDCRKPNLGLSSVERANKMEVRSYHEVVPRPPRFISFGNQRCGYERSNGCSQAIDSVKKTQYFVGIRHCTHPGIPSCIFQSVSEPSNRKDHDQNWVRWMYRNDDVCHKVADGSNESYTSLSKSKVYGVVEQG